MRTSQSAKSQNKYLEGENTAPRSVAEARALSGHLVKYLLSIDIDKSGRGYFFPRIGIVDRAINRDIVIGGDYIPYRSIVELQVLKRPQEMA